MIKLLILALLLLLPQAPAHQMNYTVEEYVNAVSEEVKEHMNDTELEREESGILVGMQWTVLEGKGIFAVQRGNETNNIDLENVTVDIIQFHNKLNGRYDYAIKLTYNNNTTWHR